MIKKVFILSFILCQSIAIKTLANEIEKSSIYEKVVIPIVAQFKNIEELPEEMQGDFNELNKMERLIKKTNAEFEIAKANSDGSFEFVKEINDLQKAIEETNDLEQTLNASIAIIDKEGKVIYSNLAMGKIVKHIDGAPYPSNNKNTDLYKDSSLQQKLIYINHGYVDDVPIIEDNGISAKIQVSGATGWINKDSSKAEFDMIVVPLNQVTNPSYYINENGILHHFISYDISGQAGKGHKIALGKAPSFMNQGQKYFSYDLEYFYNSLESLLLDQKEGSKNRAINNTEFYSYYTYLPFRSNTVFSGDELNSFIDRNTKLNSKLRGMGHALINAERKFGVNAAMILSVAINESNWGMSSIAQSKNNIFGINAIDSNPGQAANEFVTVEACIDEFVKNYISRGYSDPQDWRYEGGHLGNKELGTNVRYASDPFWGEKASKYMYQIDRELSNENLREFDSKKIGIHIANTEIKNSNNEILYPVQNSSKSGKLGSSIVINSMDDDTNYYNVNPLRTTNVNQGEFDGIYNWSGDALLNKSVVKVVNGQVNDFASGVNYTAYIDGLGWQENKSNGNMAGTSGQSKRIEGLKISLNGIENLGLTYRTHIQDVGWQYWKKEGEVAGLPNSGKRIEAIEIKQSRNSDYTIEYRAHIEDIGWQDWKSNGELAGTTGEAKRIEAIEVRVIKKVQLDNLKYSTHIEDIGWQDWKSNGEVAGTTGEAKRLESIKIAIDGLEDINDLKYRVHVQDIGWQDWKSNGEVVGTTGEAKRLEGIEIKLADKYKEKYRIVYRVHAQDIGWQDWKTDGHMAGTTGQSKRLEAIEIKVEEV
ncbi:MAG: glucosaminidase domain-containing protein [Sarcina sp.]